ncbi:GFA family protein [Luteimonas sp. R10]|uniref:GFA family protein n=1 Tax=Luteimonas sp. R10 TaxID=3108176 RepID=UPI00308E1B23|nr:DUF6151 family protein [Luteimonas sp. R10]
MSLVQHLACACGEVELTAEKAPIASVECYCDSCRAAGLRLQRLPGAPPVLGGHGGTRYVLHRKDRIRFAGGRERMKAFRLSPDAGSRRIVAGCCHTPLFLEFKGGHWLSLYGGLWPAGTLPPLQMRTMTGDLADPSALPDDVPNLRRQSGPFFLALLKAWIAMGFRSPRIPVEGDIDA